MKTKKQSVISLQRAFGHAMEHGYRRGFQQGFSTSKCKNPPTDAQVYKWRFLQKRPGAYTQSKSPPGGWGGSSTFERLRIEDGSNIRELLKDCQFTQDVLNEFLKEL